jgi:hypothetical protein
VIDFRYHVVSIVAIFLALTVGLVIGASILSGGLANGLRNDLSKANDQISNQQSEIKKLDTQLDQQGTYITDTAAQLVDGRLSGSCVAMVQIDGADTGTYAAVRTMVQKQSGALVCSDTKLNAALTAPTSQSQLTSLLKAHTPAGQKFTGGLAAQSVALIAEALTTYQPSTETGTDTGGSATPTAPATGAAGPGGSGGTGAGGRAGTTPPGGGATSSLATMSASEALATLKDFQSAGMITMATPPLAGGVPNLAYVQAPASAAGDTATDNAAYLAFAMALRKGGAGTVVGGSGGTGGSADKGGLLEAIIADATATREITTVDDTDVTMGQVASVFCLYDQSQGGATVAGHYGTGADNDGPIPPITPGLG